MKKREYLLTSTESDDDISMPSFNFWQSFRPAFDGLCLSEKGYLITWIMWYMFDNKLPIGIIENHDKDWKLLRTFRVMIPELDKQKQKYLEYLKAKRNHERKQSIHIGQGRQRPASVPHQRHQEGIVLNGHD